MNEASRTVEGQNRKAGPARTFQLGSRVVAGLVVIFALVAGVGGWIATAKLSGAVISPGQVIVDDNVKAVQHRDGGIVSEILVRQGDTVAAGDVILRLDDVQSRSELSIIHSQFLELTVKKARLIAERDGLADLVLPANVTIATPEAAAILAGETRILDGQIAHRESQKQQLALGIVQINDEVKGLESQRAAKAEEILLVNVEYSRTKTLADRKLVEESRVSTIRREELRLDGEVGGIDAAIARAKTRSGEIQLQVLAIDETARTEAQRELGGIETRLQELSERAVTLDDRLSRTDIRAPISGTIHELNIYTIGGVITPAEVLVTIVPIDAHLKVAIRLAPTTVEQVSLGSVARLRFSSFNQRTTPELKGVVTFISPATTADPATGEHYYQGHVEFLPDELAKLGDSVLLPGMPVEVFVQTDERTVASYLARPIVDQFNRAFRER